MDIREKILEASGSLFMQNGFRTVTMDMIAQSLAISKRTIYENFKDKDDLIGNVLIRGSLMNKNQLLAIIGESDNVIEALVQFCLFHYRISSTVNPVFMEDLKKYYSTVFESSLNSMVVQTQEISYTLLKKGINEGSFVKNIDLEIANKFINHTLDFIRQSNCEHHTDPDKVWRSVFYPYLKGICTPKGLELLKTVGTKYSFSVQELEKTQNKL